GLHLRSCRGCGRVRRREGSSDRDTCGGSCSRQGQEMKRTVLAGLLVALAWPSAAAATEETDALFKDGVASLQAGRPAQAIASFEALADRGVVDPSASYARGLAYAMRVRIGGEVAGDLGRSAQ